MCPANGIFNNFEFSTNLDNSKTVSLTDTHVLFSIIYIIPENRRISLPP
ncbi:hypothetical protein NIES4071_83310 [Calothrix sp. NIES-4071]|nr:hypothetical protein NIES4071_83310 [Calothrix sp. NIES-4071]BAZ62599.1 hypothetical protein NIES4105_83240 [Calothrix sp. NIES-4105]